MSLSSASPSVFTASEPELALAVLVVDDDASNRLLVARWLERVGLSAVEAESGEVALRLLERAPRAFGAVLLDVVMPELGGYAVLERIHANPSLRDMPVVMLTAHAQPEADVLFGLRHGAVDHLSKPFRGPILAAKLRALVERRARALALEERLQAAEASARTDSMTGLGNRRQFDEELEREQAYARRHAVPLALWLVDIDKLERVNDAYGHSAGDEVIRATAQLLLANLRSSDRAFRIGGEELAVLLRGLDRASAVCAAERFARARGQRKHRFDDSGAVAVTASVGVAAADAGNQLDLRELFQRAGRALYVAKQQGRGRVSADAG